MSNQPSRRDFLKSSVIAGISVYIAAPGSNALAALLEKERLRRLPWDAQKRAHRRHGTDATAKVTGDKIFSFDMRGRDLPGWPREQAHAMLLRVTRADRAYAGFDLSRLGAGPGARPRRYRLGSTARWHRVSAVLRADMLLPEGATPAYLGHAVALLIWTIPVFSRREERAGVSTTM